MIAASRTAFILLAAGRSSRFGAEKLLHRLGGEALVALAARRGQGFAERIAVVRADRVNEMALELPGFRLIANADPDAGLSRSLAIGISAVGESSEAALVMLGDMPFVGADHIAALLARFDVEEGRVTSRVGGLHQPPALFGRAMFATLGSITGDQGARAWLAGAPAIDAPAGQLRDIDRPSDLI